MVTFLIERGKQDKLRAADLLGALTGDVGLPGDAVGKIDILPTRSYVAIKREHAGAALQKLTGGKNQGPVFPRAAAGLRAAGQPGRRRLSRRNGRPKPSKRDQPDRPGAAGDAATRGAAADPRAIGRIGRGSRRDHGGRRGGAGWRTGRGGWVAAQVNLREDRRWGGLDPDDVRRDLHLVATARNAWRGIFSGGCAPKTSSAGDDGS